MWHKTCPQHTLARQPEASPPQSVADTTPQHRPLGQGPPALLPPHRGGRHCRHCPCYPDEDTEAPGTQRPVAVRPLGSGRGRTLSPVLRWRHSCFSKPPGHPPTGSPLFLQEQRRPGPGTLRPPPSPAHCAWGGRAGGSSQAVSEGPRAEGSRTSLLERGGGRGWRAGAAGGRAQLLW